MATDASPMAEKGLLLAIVEQGGYPNFTSLYQQQGYEVRMENAMRKVLALLKKKTPGVIVAEFNFQPAFRDRISNLESLIAVAQRRPEMKMIVFYDREFEHQLKRLQDTYQFFAALPFPIDEQALTKALQRTTTAA